jgi:hypothetical protein
MWNCVGRSRLNLEGSEEVSERCGRSRWALVIGRKRCGGSRWVLSWKGCRRVLWV